MEIFKPKNGKAIFLRHCTPKDAAVFPDFEKTIAAETSFTKLGGFNIDTADSIEKRLVLSEANPRMLELGAFLESGEMHGLLVFHAIREGHPWLRHIGRFGLMIRQINWGHGLGHRMLELLEKFAISANFKRIESEVHIENDRALHLYKTLGYEVEGIRKKALYINGKYFDEHYIARLLP